MFMRHPEAVRSKNSGEPMGIRNGEIRVQITPDMSVDHDFTLHFRRYVGIDIGFESFQNRWRRIVREDDLS